MRIEALSIRAVTVAIICMIGVVAIVLSLLAGTYFRGAALDSQMSSLSRVIEVASQEMLGEVGRYTQDLGMKLAHSRELLQALQDRKEAGGQERLVALLDDPFVSGFVGFAKIDLQKLRVYSLDLEFICESSAGMQGLDRQLAGHLVETLGQRRRTDRLKAVDALWLSAKGPLYSTLVPLGGLRAIGYLEVVVDPSFNLPDIGLITRTPISIFTADGARIGASGADPVEGMLPVEYLLPATGGEPAFRIIGYEDVDRLNAAMTRTQMVTTGGFLLLTAGSLLFALWLFHHFLFVPLGRLVENMKQIASGQLDLAVSRKGLREFAMLADSFETMASQVMKRTGDLQRLLDLDDSAILCFGQDGEVVYLNRSATELFGYTSDDTGELELGDLFVEDVAQLMADAPGPESGGLHVRLDCIRRGGQVFHCDAAVNPQEVMDGAGYTIVLDPVAGEGEGGLPDRVIDTIEKHEQRMHAVETSLNSILEIARSSPGLISGVGAAEAAAPDRQRADDRERLREQAVAVMRAALECWEHDLGKSKLELAEESGIWPVYIDKSTPTTRTLDRYLHVDSCPQKPRSQRVIDTAEFVLRQMSRRNTQYRRQLQDALDAYRLLLSGLKA
jgi:PAS domain S-box-containing protein